jgi:hypothetical protein
MNCKHAAVLATLALASLSGCSSSTNAKTTNTAASPSSSPTTAPPPAVSDRPVDGGALAARMSKAMTASGTAHLGQSLNGASPGEGDIALGDPVKVAFASGQGPKKIEIVAVGGSTYMKGAAGTSSKPWFKLDPRGTDAFSKATSSVNDISRSVDPRLMASMMKGVQGVDVGKDQVRGVATEHYAFQVPFSGASKMLGPQSRKLMQGMVTQGTLKMPMVVHYWVGHDNLPLRIGVVMEVSGQKQTTDATFSAWGKRVNIDAPPAAQVGPRPGL